MDITRIMFVDDEATANELYVRAMRREGYRVDFVDDTDRAVEVIARRLQDYDMVVLDLMMPPGETYKSTDTLEGLRTGEFLFDEIRKRMQQMPIVVLTNRKRPEIPNRLSEDKASSVVAKIDCTPDELVGIVKGVATAEVAG